MATQRYCGTHILGQKPNECEKCMEEKLRCLRNEQQAIKNGILIWDEKLKDYKLFTS